MRQGRIALCFATLFARSTAQPSPYVDYASPTQSYGVARGQLAYYRALEQEGHIHIITDKTGLVGHIGDWQTWEAKADVDNTPPLGFVVSMEGADPILKPD